MIEKRVMIETKDLCAVILQLQRVLGCDVYFGWDTENACFKFLVSPEVAVNSSRTYGLIASAMFSAWGYRNDFTVQVVGRLGSGGEDKTT